MSTITSLQEQKRRSQLRLVVRRSNRAKYTSAFPVRLPCVGVCADRLTIQLPEIHFNSFSKQLTLTADTMGSWDMYSCLWIPCQLPGCLVLYQLHSVYI